MSRFSTPAPPGASQRDVEIAFVDDPQQDGNVPMMPMYEVQSLTMEMGPDSAVQEEGVNATSDSIFAHENKVSRKC